MPIKQILSAMIAIFMLFGFGNSAYATVWNIDAVLTGAGVSGFGASGFHRASDSTPMSGNDLGTITASSGMFGTWNDVSGVFNATFDLTAATGPEAPLNGGPTVDVDGTVLFGTGDSFLVGLRTLTVVFAGTSLFNSPNTGELFFEPGNVCCSATNGPNSLVSDSTGKIMTLWGANGYDVFGSTYAGGNDTDLGMDLRVHLSQASVPEPMTVMLMGLGLLGLGFGRRMLSVG